MLEWEFYCVSGTVELFPLCTQQSNSESTLQTSLEKESTKTTYPVHTHSSILFDLLTRAQQILRKC
jgi:hypothetical protein